MRPYLVKKITTPEGATIQETAPSARHRVISDATADVVKRMLKSVVSEGGTGEKAAVAGYSVAGKTGTAQKIDRQRGGYSHKWADASFAGFAPADGQPRITVIVIIHEPQRMSYGGEIAAPAFSRIARLVLNYLHVVPDNLPEPLDKNWRKARLIASEKITRDET